MADDSVAEIVREVRDATRDIAVKAIESLLADKQGFDLDDYTIRACANIVRSLGSRALSIPLVEE